MPSHGVSWWRVFWCVNAVHLPPWWRASMGDDYGAGGSICWRLLRVPSRQHSACAPHLWRLTTGSHQSGMGRGDGSASTLAPLGPTISNQAVGPILQRPGIPPAPARTQPSPWQVVLRRPRTVLEATDCYTRGVWQGDWCVLEDSWGVPTVMARCRERACAHRCREPIQTMESGGVRHGGFCRSGAPGSVTAGSG